MLEWSPVYWNLLTKPRVLAPGVPPTRDREGYSKHTVPLIKRVVRSRLHDSPPTPTSDPPHLFSSIRRVMVVAADIHCRWTSRDTCSAAPARSPAALSFTAQACSWVRSCPTSARSLALTCTGHPMIHIRAFRARPPALPPSISRYEMHFSPFFLDPPFHRRF